MLLEKITEQEIQMMENYYNPVCQVESNFHNFDSLGEFSEDKLGNLRYYQRPFLSFEPMIDTENKKLNKKENFEQRKGVGDIYNFGARLFGKSLVTEKLDIPISMITDDGMWCGFGSLDSIHIRGILDSVRQAVDNHPIISTFKRRVTTHPDYLITAKNGWKLESVNFNLGSKSPGAQFFGKHFEKLWIEEASFESEEVYNAREDAGSELGCVFRFSGMTNFIRHSPAGKQFFAQENKNKTINLPQYVNPFFNNTERRKRLKKYGGEDSLNYRVFVKGEIIQDGINEFDPERLQEAYLKGRKIKRFEINKDRFKQFKDYIVVERPKNAERIFINADVGEKVTEINVVSEIEKTYRYLYNIVLYNLTHIQQVKVFKHLIREFSADVVGLDCGDGMGRAIYRELEDFFPKENLVWYDGSMKIDIDFEKDEQGNIIMKKGKPIYRQESMAEWSVRHLKYLLYEKYLRIPEDFKFDTQINAVVSMKKGNRTIYECVTASGNHLFDSFRVFAIAQFSKSNSKPVVNVNGNWGVGVFS